MKRLINRIVSIVDSFDCWECIVKVCFFDFLSVAVNIVKSRDSIDGYEIGGHSDVRAVFFMQCVQPEMPVSF